MEGAEVIIETYIRLIKKWFTISNIVFPGNEEIDLLAMDADGQVYHIEIAISINEAFAALNDEPLANIADQAARRRSIYFFIDRFQRIQSLLSTHNWFINDQLQEIKQIVVTWSATSGAKAVARNNNIDIWYLPKIVSKLIGFTLSVPQYLRDQERIFQLIAYSISLKTILKRIKPGIRVSREVSEANPIELIESICRKAIRRAEEQHRLTIRPEDFRGVEEQDGFLCG